MTRNRWLLLALVAFALMVRVWPLDWDNYRFFHPDERRIAMAVEELSFSPVQLNPHFFAYGSLPFYVNRAVVGVLGAVQGLLPGNLINFRFNSYDGAMITGRVISAVWGAATVLLLAFFGTRIYGPRVGLLAAFLLAASVSPVQNSHFGTNDTPLAFLVLLALYFLVRVVQEGQLRHYLLGGFLIGLAAATKFSALPLLAPLGIAGLYRARSDGFGRIVLYGLGATAMVVLGFFIGEPFAVFDWPAYSHDIFEQSEMVRNAGLLPYTNQYIGAPKYLYELREMVLWGMGPLLGIAAIWGTALRTGRAVRSFNAIEIVLLAWVIPFFLVSGSFDVKFPRYMLPIYPLLILWAAAWLDEWAQRSRIGRAALWTVVGGTVAALAAFMSIYTRPFTVEEASEWVYANIPAGSKILSQDWDEGFPFHLPGRPPSRYDIKNLPYYEPDTPSKIALLARELASGDYIAFQTKRLYGAVTRERSDEKYKYTSRYFFELFAGDLGYTLVKEIASRPSLFGIEFPSELADESFSVYDHPKVLIFQNTGRLSAAEIQQKILNDRPSKNLTRNDLLLAGVDTAQNLGRSSRPRWVRSSVLATLLLAAWLEAIGLAMYCLLRPVLTPRPGLYALSKVLAVLLISYVPWLAVGIGWLSFTSTLMTTVTAVFLALGLVAYRRHRDLEFPRAEVRASEVLFWGAFLFFLLIRAFNPEIYWGEKPMDFSFLNSIYRTTTLPPPEPWFAGSPLYYTYFGYFIAAAAGKCLNIHPALMFNLAIAMFGGLTAASVFAAGTALTRRWPVGIAAATLATILGNLAGLREFLQRRTINFDYWWATSRVIKDTINEYPLWSFLFADLHAHLMVMPFTVAFICLLLFWAQRRDRVSAHVPLSSVPALLFLLSLTLGAIMVTNGWSTPTYAALLVAMLMLYWVTTHVWTGVLGLVASFVGRVILPTIIILPFAVLLYRPFWNYFTPPPRNWGWEHIQFAGPYDYLTIFGFFVLALVPFFFVVWRRLLADESGRLNSAHRLLLGGTAALLLVLLLFDVEGLFSSVVGSLFGAFTIGPWELGPIPFGPFTIEAASGPVFDWAQSVRLFAFTAGAIGGVLAIHPRTPREYRLPLGLGAFAFIVTGGVDVIHVWDRMNTVFKFYLEAWFMFAIAAGAVVWALLRGDLGRGVAVRIWQGGLLALALLATFTSVTSVVAVVNTKRVPTDRPTLDGMSYLDQFAPMEKAAYEWLNENVPGIPVLLEAHGPSYQEFSRVTMNTGIPIVLGWDYHLEQRAQRRADINRRKADIESIYTGTTKDQVAALLQRYKIALVYVGPLERRTYQGGNLENFKQWTDVLTPVYENRAVTIFAVNGQYGGSIPQTTIEEIQVEGLEEEVRHQDPGGRLQQPRGVAADAQGNVYVGDFGNNRIQKFDPDLKFVTTWGKGGELPGEFKEPCGVAVGPDGSVFVADTWNQRVQVFDPTGKYLREWGAGFYGPRGIAVDNQGSVYVADTGNHKIQRFAADGKKEMEWGGHGSEEGKFADPIGVTTDSEGRVYVADNGNGRLQIFDRSGKFIRAFPVSDWKTEVFSEPNMVVDPSGTLWVTVPLAKEIRGYSIEGKLLATITSAPAPHNFETPMGITYDPISKQFVISDLEHRIVRLPIPKGQ